MTTRDKERCYELRSLNVVKWRLYSSDNRIRRIEGYIKLAISK